MDGLCFFTHSLHKLVSLPPWICCSFRDFGIFTSNWRKLGGPFIPRINTGIRVTLFQSILGPLELKGIFQKSLILHSLALRPNGKFDQMTQRIRMRVLFEYLAAQNIAFIRAVAAHFLHLYQKFHPSLYAQLLRMWVLNQIGKRRWSYLVPLQLSCCGSSLFYSLICMQSHVVTLRASETIHCLPSTAPTRCVRHD